MLLGELPSSNYKCPSDWKKGEDERDEHDDDDEEEDRGEGGVGRK